MVLHQNVNIGQRVEVKVRNRIYKGTVKYKGAIIHKPGDWVGVSLEQPVGENDGMLMGRRYFQCTINHGIFVRANCIRFIPLTRWTYNKYHKVADTAEVDEPLFSTYSRPNTSDPSLITEDMKRRVKIGASLEDSTFGQSKRYYPLRHSVGNKIPAATMTRSASSMSSFNYTTRPIHSEYDIEDDFITYPSIPKAHMPYSALRNQVKRGWEGTHYVREMSVGTGRDSMKFSQWNDISP